MPPPPLRFPPPLFVVACFACLLSAIVRAELVVPPLFGDHAILQRDLPIAIWGTDTPGTRVTITLGDATPVHAVAAQSDGRWSAALPPRPAAARPLDLTIRGSSTHVAQDVLIGEVWLASGQSNMEWRVYHSRDEDLVRATARFPAIRELKVARASLDTPTTELAGAWRPATPEHVGNFSAVAHAFARDVHLALDVPVGILHVAYGGSRLEAWLPPHEIAAIGDTARFEQPFLNPGALWNGMLAPVVPFTVRGVLWYQGESNVGQHALYPDRFTRLITSWRAAFERDDLPFHWVQLSSFRADDPDGTAWARLRESQGRALALPHTGQAISYDLGDASDIHPPDKTPVGRRLARLALSRTYGLNHPDRGPEPRELRREGAGFRIVFDHAPRGLRSPGRDVLGFELAGADRVFHPADAAIHNDSVLVAADAVPDPVAVRYAWRNVTPANLYNHHLLPAPPFRSDDW